MKPHARVEHVDVLIVGAGLTGIGAASRLQVSCPGKSYAILEARDSMGGTWDLFRYPGIRADSDMFTLAYSLRPWRKPKSIVDGHSILSYIRETAREHDIERMIRFNHRVVRAEWSSADARWTVEVERTDGGETVHLTCGFLYACTGYYRYDQGHTPDFPGRERFAGRIIHPQHWPEDLDYAGKRVVVIGSGATAVTLIPAMAESAAHVTMLQRSPSYVMSVPARDPLANLMNRKLPAKVAGSIMRWRNASIAALIFALSRRAPGLMKRLLRKGVERRLPEGYAIDPHFTPRYEPWDQRLCLVPDGDLFKTVSSGAATVVTDGIETFTEKGLELTSGAELPADIVVTATGFNLLMFGGMTMAVDGREVDLSEVVMYKGMMFTGIPNLALVLGYTNASWTLKADLVGEYVCRLLNHMNEHGYRQCVPHHPDPSSAIDPVLDLNSGYVMRSIESLPKQGSKMPWRLHQNYARDVLVMRFGKLDDGAMRFTNGDRPGVRTGPAQIPASPGSVPARSQDSR